MSTVKEPVEKPVSRIRRIVVGLLLLAALLAAGFVARLVAERQRTESELDLLVARLDRDDPGWRFQELLNAREEIPLGENSAGVVVAVGRAKPARGPSTNLSTALEAWSLPGLLPDQVRADLDGYLKLVASEVLAARRLAKMPRGRHELGDVSNPMLIVLDHVQMARDVSYLLQLDAIERAHQKRFEEALTSCRAALNAGRSIGDEPFAISQLVRVACFTGTADTIERVLALGEVSEQQLAKLADLVAEEEKHPGLLIGLRGERAGQHELMTGLSSGRISIEQILRLLSMRNDWLLYRERLAGWQLRNEFRSWHPRLLSYCERAVKLATLPAHERQAEEKMLIRDYSAARTISLPLELGFPGFKLQFEAHRAHLARLRCLRASLAVERHRLVHGDWPAGLVEPLVDPYDGKPLRYLRRGDGVTVYSVGENGTDEGGKIHNRDARRGDLGYRLWDREKRGIAAREKKE